MAKFAPIKYLREVRAESRKVTWPSRSETTMSTIAVFVMVTLASIFLYFSDQILAWLLRLIMGFNL